MSQTSYKVELVNPYDLLDISSIFLWCDEVNELYNLSLDNSSGEKGLMNIFKGCKYPIVMKVSSSLVSDFMIDDVEVIIKDSAGVAIDDAVVSDAIEKVIDNENNLAGFSWDTSKFEIGQYIVNMWITIKSGENTYKLTSGNLNENLKDLSIRLGN